VHRVFGATGRPASRPRSGRPRTGDVTAGSTCSEGAMKVAIYARYSRACRRGPWSVRELLVGHAELLRHGRERRVSRPQCQAADQG
jgi:hypothetical protein